MANKKNIFSLLYQLWNHIKSSRKIYFLFYILLTFLCALAEIISIGSIIPFLTIFISPDKILNYEPISFLIKYFNIISEFLLYLCMHNLFAIQMSTIEICYMFIIFSCRIL